MPLDPLTNQNGPGWALGYVPTPLEWEAAFAGKQDAHVVIPKVVGNGVADDTAAIQAAIDACITSGSPLLLPPGTMKITTALNVHGQLSIVGAGKTATMLSAGNTGMTVVSINTTAPCTLQGFGISPGGSVSGITGISVNPASGGVNTESVFRDLHVISCNVGIDFVAAAYWTMDAVFVELFGQIGVKVRNGVNPDEGDCSIYSCLFDGGSGNSTGVGVQQFSAGGLKISNSKFLSGLYGYAMTLDPIATGDLLITGCSMEGQHGASVYFSQRVTGGTFHSAVITGCQFNLTPSAINVANITPGWLTDLTTSGCTVYMALNGIGLYLDGVTGFVISGWNFYTLFTGATCIQCTNHTANGTIGVNNRFGSGIANYVLNASAGNSTTITPRFESGSVAVTTTTSYGATGYYYGTGSITFPTPFLGNPPKVTFTVKDVSQLPIACHLGSTPSLSAAVVQMIGCVNGQTYNIDWTAEGDI